jgi:hypothetical protein
MVTLSVERLQGSELIMSGDSDRRGGDGRLTSTEYGDIMSKVSASRVWRSELKCTIGAVLHQAVDGGYCISFHPLSSGRLTWIILDECDNEASSAGYDT